MMHVQPEAKAIKVGRRPLWAPGAPQELEEFIAARKGNVRVLEFGSGGSTIFLLRCGASVVTVEHHEQWAETLQLAAANQGLADRLTILRRDRPYSGVGEELRESERFDILLVDGRERIDCLLHSLPLLKSEGLVLLDDSQRRRYWPAFALMAQWPCVTFESAARDTSIWTVDEAREQADFVIKTFVPSEPVEEPRRRAIMVPREFLTCKTLEAGYVRPDRIEDLGPTERDLQSIGLIETSATYTAPHLYELEDAAVRIDAGQKLLRYRDVVYRSRSTDYVKIDRNDGFGGAVHLPGRTLDLTAAGAGRYSFFILDSLPKLKLLRAYGQCIDDFDTILVNSGAKWIREILSSALGASAVKVRFFNKDAPSFRMETSVHIEGIRSSRFTPRWVHDYLAQVFDPGQPGSDAHAVESLGPFVYISRQRASGRSLINHDEFLRLVEPLGFKEIHAEDYTPSELAVALADTKVLISPHGAGLANIIFCPPGADVIELFSSHFTPQYIHLARDRGQRYMALAGVDVHGRNVFDRFDATTKNKSEFNREDIVVPIEELRRILNSLCKNG